jgi:PDZ domain
MVLPAGLAMKPLMRAAVLFFIAIVLVSAVLSQRSPAAKGFIGLALADPHGSRGALVSHVKPGGPAETAGVREGDIIIAIDSSSVDKAATMTRIIGSMTPKQIVRLSILRGNEHRTIAVALGSADDADRVTTSAAAIATVSSAPSITTGPNASAPPLNRPGYVRLTDPLEQSFTIDAPSGWRSETGLARRSALQINAYFRSLSPDKMTYLLIGEPTLPSFVPPSQMGNAIGYREGTLYDAGLGGYSLVLHYLPGAQFARMYGETALQGLCPSFRLSSVRDRPDLARQGASHWPTVIPSREDGGEARFTCVHNKQEMDVRVEAATRIARNNIGWSK